MPKRKLDEIDIELLRLLLINSRQTTLQLSEKLKIHKDTVRKRINKLVSQKIIDRFTIAINHDKLTELYPSLWKVLFAVAVLSEHNSLVKELLSHKNVVEVDEATPSAVHSLLVQTQFANMKEYVEFTNWLKSNENVDSSRLDVTPIYKQHKKRVRLLAFHQNPGGKQSTNINRY